MTARDRANPAYAKVTRALRPEFAALPAGYLLPGEAQLGRRFGYSRQTIRVALHTLMDEGLIELLPTKRGYRTTARERGDDPCQGCGVALIRDLTVGQVDGPAWPVEATPVTTGEQTTFPLHTPARCLAQRMSA